MRPSTATVFRVLSAEAVSDGVRRRIVPVIAVVSLLSLTVIDSCTSCASQIVIKGQEAQIPEVAGWSGMLILVVLGLWTVVLAGVLASDHLVETLENGAARGVLARPVGRGAFALSRLLGALVITFITGALLLGTAAFLLHTRQGLDLAPVLWAGLACAASASIVGSLAMAVSVALPRIATTLLVLLLVGGVSAVNAFGLAGQTLEGVAGWIDRAGPPLSSAMVVALAPWIEPTQIVGEPIELGLRLALWTVGGVSLLVVVFRRTDIGA